MIIFTDGACSGNPGPGGFGVVILDNNENLITYYSEQCQQTTNNREELKAILWAFLRFGEPAAAGNEIPIVYSDSAYAVNTFTSWMFNWAKNGWIKSDKKIPENLDLIKPFYEYWQRGFKIELKQVKGHSNNQWNDFADVLATNNIAKKEKILYNIIYNKKEGV